MRGVGLEPPPESELALFSKEWRRTEGERWEMRNTNFQWYRELSFYGASTASVISVRIQ